MKKNRLYFNANIFTMSGDLKPCNSMAVQGKTIVAVGNNLDSDDDFKNHERVDLKGKTVIPGFHDAHTHIMFTAMALGMVDLDGITSMTAVLNAIKKHCRNLPLNSWVEGLGFSPDRLKQYVMPDRYLLDKVTGGRPAAIFSKDQHLMWVNSKALELVKYNNKTKNPDGGVIEKFENGEPTGILKEYPAYGPIYELASKQNKSRRIEYFRKYLPHIYSRGVTAVTSVDGPESFDNFLELSDKNQIGLRVYHYVAPEIARRLNRPLISKINANEYYRVCGVKLFSDGALGSQSALCFNKYIGSQDNYGVETLTKRELLSIIKMAVGKGLPAAIHAIGDKAIANVLDCYEKAPRLKLPARHRIEHLQMIRRKDIRRLKNMGVIASVQPSHCPSDVKLIENYWGSRGRNCYIFKTLLDNNIPLAFGSDTPIEPLDPIAGIAAAVNRFAIGTQKPFYPEQRLSVYDAVAGFTSGAAYACGHEYEIGRLLPGYKADFVILDKNIFKTARTRIDKVKVEATIFDGKPVFQKPGSRIDL